VQSVIDFHPPKINLCQFLKIKEQIDRSLNHPHCTLRARAGMQRHLAARARGARARHPGHADAKVAAHVTAGGWRRRICRMGSAEDAALTLGVDGIVRIILFGRRQQP
jgi:hypothetical protein